ncbi:transcription factor Adf-1-like [Maniola jurtina]|uniref:transcription factor Adf-1-like n=1 Tax=Maniola jurtina TaxID=191418 RepID=UPI001E68ECE6|nr:transcription factor Adf-1-like [Maniola jurtina]
MNTREYREKLIDEVKKYPVLYDTRHENHRDIDVRDRCWMEISDRLGANCEILKREWKILRDSLRQSLRKSNKGATTKAGVPCKKWRFQNRMAFVLPYMTKRRNPRQLRDDIKIDETEVQSEQEQDSEVWDPGNGNSDSDSLDLYFASVCQSTKRLPKKYQNQIKREVLDTLLRIEEQYEADERESKMPVSKIY